LAATPALAQGQSPPPAGQPRPPSISVTTVERAEVTAAVLVSGNIVAREEILVQPEVDGLAVIDILVEEGDAVRQGQVLARLNRAALDVALAQNSASLQRVEAAIAQARAQIAEADANRTQTANAFTRAQALRSEGITSADAFDQRQAAARAAEARLTSARQSLAIAEAELASARAQRGEIELRIARSEIKAPRDGVILRRNARLGSIAMMGATEPMFRLIAQGAVEMEAEVPEADIPRLTVGNPVAVTPAGMADAIKGEIRLISREVDRATRLGRVRIALPGASVRSVGAFARGVIEIERRTGLTVPVAAITYRRDTATVQVVRDNKVSIREVKLGIVGNGLVEIRSGVAEGDVVVARAGTFVRDGDIITPVPMARPPATAALTR
jgi:HlyD family secretion protein